jgi:hypothetical protein
MMNLAMRLRRGAVAGLAAVAVSALVVSVAQGQTAPTPTDPRDINGNWELSFDGRNVPPASLASEVTRDVLDEIARKDVRSVRWCLPLGMPFTMGQPRPIDIRVGTRYVALTAESAVAPVRYLYLNRSAHIAKDEYEPTTSGDSIARWDGDTLVVQTVGFSASKGVLSIPGGGFRTEDTRLTERFRLLKNGSMLSVTFTWDDPKVFRTPHTYEFRYHRLPAGYEPRPALPCDPFDDDRTAFLEKAPQPAK